MKYRCYVKIIRSENWFDVDDEKNRDLLPGLVKMAFKKDMTMDQTQMVGHDPRGSLLRVARLFSRN